MIFQINIRVNTFNFYSASLFINLIAYQKTNRMYPSLSDDIIMIFIFRYNI